MATQNPADIENVEKLLKDYQIMQEQLRNVAMQLEQMQAQKIEMERAKEELEKANGKVYRSVGNVIIESSKEKALLDVTDKHSLTSARIQSLNKQFNDMKTKEKQLNEKLTQIYKGGQGQQ